MPSKRCGRENTLSEVTAFFTPAQGVELVEAASDRESHNLAGNYPFTKKTCTWPLYREGFFGEMTYASTNMHGGESLCLLSEWAAAGSRQSAASLARLAQLSLLLHAPLGPVMIITGLRPESRCLPKMC